MTMRSEIGEQPAVFARALDENKGPMADVARQLGSSGFEYALIAARGTSDNAARYAKYLWAAHNRIPVALAAPSLFTSYNRPPKLDGALVVGISQSGESPDLVAVVTEGRRRGDRRWSSPTNPTRRWLVRRTWSSTSRQDGN
jgi:glucosamine--fructose-6-phosphate aminotransferase (isomerizing)